MVRHESLALRIPPTSATNYKGITLYLIFSVVLLIFTFGTHTVLAQTNLIRDGGFEIGLVEPGFAKLGLGRYGAWTSPSTGSCFGSTELMGLPFPRVLGSTPLPAYEGVEGLNLGPCFGGGRVTQAFKTTIGGEYKVSLAVIGGNVKTTVFNDSNIDLAADFVSKDHSVWTMISYTFTATRIDSTIMLDNSSLMTDSCCAPMIDDVRVILIEKNT